MSLKMKRRLFLALIGQSWAYQDIQLNSINLSQFTTLRPVTVAVIDTGLDLKGIDWQSQLWLNKGETGKDALGRDRSNNGVDDDKNGFIDDVHGWDFVKDKPIKDDNNGHGTHVSGIIHTISPTARIMILKYYAPQLPAQKTIEYTAQAIRYAVNMGAEVINYSGGGASPSQMEQGSIEWAQQKGVTVVAAAGNNGTDNDKEPYFPASYEFSNIISVAAYGTKGLRIPSSNFGSFSVDLAAPGEDVLSSLPKNQIGTMTGTSQATAVTSGALALWLSLQPSRVPPYLASEHMRESSQYIVPSALSAFEKPKINIPRLIFMKNDENAQVPASPLLSDFENL